jgi:hypothetical protein
VGVAKKAQMMEAFLYKNEGDKEALSDWGLDTLASYVVALREQLMRMEHDWDRVRNQIMPQVSQMVDESMLFGEDVLDRFVLLGRKPVPSVVHPPPAAANQGQDSAGTGFMLETTKCVPPVVGPSMPCAHDTKKRTSLGRSLVG